MKRTPRYILTRIKNIISFRERLRDYLGITWGHMSFTSETEEAVRYTFKGIGEDSVAFDLGGYSGEWAERIYKKYSPNIYIFEPIHKYYENIARKFTGNQKIRVFDFGLAGNTRKVRMSVDEVKSSEFCDSPNGEEVKLVRAVDFFREKGIDHIDLMKINIEGGEYELLDHLIETGFINNIDDVVVQFHRFVPHARSRRRAIRKALRKTHYPTYSMAFVWENWKKR